MKEKFDGVIGIVFRREEPAKFVLIHNHRSGNMTFPAGGREEGEDSGLETLEREIEEETGLSSSDYKVIETGIVHEFVYAANKKERAGQTARQPVYLVETEKDDLQPKDEDVSIAGWYTKEEMMEKLTFSDSKEIFQKAIDSAGL